MDVHRVYSCYIPSNVSAEVVEKFLDISMDIRGTRRVIVLGGDFNAKSYFWGNKQDARGDTLAE